MSLINDLIHAIKKDDIESIRSMLQECTVNINDIDEKQWSPLHHACRHKTSDIAELLIDYGADMNACNDKGSTPLHIASGYNSTSIVKLLHAPSKNHRNLCGNTALHLACRNNSVESVEILLENGYDINCCNNDNWTPLHTCAQYGNIKVATVLIVHGCLRDIKNIYNKVAYDIAHEKKHKNILELLDCTTTISCCGCKKTLVLGLHQQQVSLKLSSLKISDYVLNTELKKLITEQLDIERQKIFNLESTILQMNEQILQLTSLVHTKSQSQSQPSIQFQPLVQSQPVQSQPRPPIQFQPRPPIQFQPRPLQDYYTQFEKCESEVSDMPLYFEWKDIFDEDDEI